MKKRWMFLMVMMVSLFATIVYAAEVQVQINGDIINFDDANAQIINDRTMVPFRKIFNVLGVENDNIEWNGDTRSIKARKNEIEIELQIGNNNAEKKIGGQSTKITLDSAPVIRNDRTLVPLRFIAESLGKTVGWDATNKTAIIIDYDYFMNCIKEKSNALYQFLLADSSHVNVSITRNYTDEKDSANNNTAIVTADIVEQKEENAIKQNVMVHFSGTNELMKEIASEGWADIQYENNYYEDYFTTKAVDDGLKKVYGQEQLKFLYSGLKCEGNPRDSISDVFKNMCNIDEKTMNIQTFNTRKTEFSDFLKLFKTTTDMKLQTGNISSDAIPLKYFDFTKLDNMLFDSSINRVYSLLNSQIFNYDITLEELLYDYPKMNMTISINNLELTIDFILSNEYNEKVEYIIKINK